MKQTYYKSIYKIDIPLSQKFKGCSFGQYRAEHGMRLLDGSLLSAPHGIDVYKRQVYGHVSIDSVAGPSEILVLADETANPRYVAADLLSQAEHDELASAILVTTSRELAEQLSLIHIYFVCRTGKRILQRAYGCIGGIQTGSK